MAAATAAAKAAARSLLRVDMMSQPCRAVVLLCRATGADVPVANVIIHRGETRTPAHRALNPMGTVPTYEEWDAGAAESAPASFVLTESTSIARYLASTRREAAAWYPGGDGSVAGARTRARQDELLDWYHASLRPGTKNWVFETVLAPVLGLPANAVAAEAGRKQYERCARIMDRWLATRPFLAGDAPTLSDLFVACELSQLALLPPSAWSAESFAAAHPATAAWHARLAAHLAPHWDATHALLNRAAAKFNVSRGPAVPAAKL